MFVILLTYVKPLDEIDAVLPEHRGYLDRGYAQGKQSENFEPKRALFYVLASTPETQVLRFEDGSMLMLSPGKEEALLPV